MSSIFKKTREFIVEEKDVIDVLKAINKHLGWLDGQVGNCGWAEEPTKWFITFDATDKKYGRIINDLNEIGEFKLDVRPKGQMDVYFERYEEVKGGANS